MRLHWTPEAQADRLAIYDYIEAGNPHAALALDELFHEQTARLTEHPGIGRPGRVPGTRELVVHRSYIVVYDMANAAIRIVRLLHAAQQWPRESS